MSQLHIDRWTSEAASLDANAVHTPGMPLPVLFYEAGLAADFVAAYWQPAEDRPGLIEAAAFMPFAIADEIKSLAMAANTLNARVVLATKDDPQAVLMEQCRSVATTLMSYLRYVLDDGESTSGDSAWEVIRQREASLTSPAELAQLLADLAVLAEHERLTLTKLPSFNVELIATANSLAEQLLLSGRVLGRRASADLALRDRVLTLLAKRVTLVRRTARFLFRDHPEIVRQVTSRYQRQRRLASSSKDTDAADAAVGADV